MYHFLENLQVSLLWIADQHCQPGWVYAPEVQRFNKFFCIYAGEGWVRIADQEFTPAPGDVLLLPEGKVQAVHEISENRFKKFSCHFSAKIGNANLFDIMPAPYKFSSGEHFPMFLDLFRRLHLAYQDPSPLRAITTKALLLECIAGYLQLAGDGDAAVQISDPLQRLQPILQQMNQQLRDPLSIEEYAAMAHLHPNYFIRVFKRFMGVTPKQYLLRLRLDHARMLLETTELPLTTIAEETGFSDPFSLSHSFKQHLGTSPNDHRKTRTFTR